MGGHHLSELDQHGADEDELTSKATIGPTFVAACYGSTVQGDMTILTVTSCGSLKSWTLSGMDGMQAMMAQRCIQQHLQLVSLLHR